MSYILRWAKANFFHVCRRHCLKFAALGLMSIILGLACAFTPALYRQADRPAEETLTGIIGATVMKITPMKAMLYANRNGSDLCATAEKTADDPQLWESGKLFILLVALSSDRHSICLAEYPLVLNQKTGAYEGNHASHKRIISLAGADLSNAYYGKPVHLENVFRQFPNFQTDPAYMNFMGLGELYRYPQTMADLSGSFTQAVLAPRISYRRWRFAIFCGLGVILIMIPLGFTLKNYLILAIKLTGEGMYAHCPFTLSEYMKARDLRGFIWFYIEDLQTRFKREREAAIRELQVAQSAAMRAKAAPPPDPAAERQKKLEQKYQKYLNCWADLKPQNERDICPEAQELWMAIGTTADLERKCELLKQANDFQRTANRRTFGASKLAKAF